MRSPADTCLVFLAARDVILVLVQVRRRPAHDPRGDCARNRAQRKVSSETSAVCHHQFLLLSAEALSLSSNERAHRTDGRHHVTPPSRGALRLAAAIPATPATAQEAFPVADCATGPAMSSAVLHGGTEQRRRRFGENGTQA
jgi:hypothetical protein